MTNNFDLTGKVAIVTGAARGIGKAIAQGLATAGANVVIADIKQIEAEQTAQIIQESGGEAVAIYTDVTNRQDCADLIQQTVARYKHLDIMVCNAGIDMIKKPAELLEDNEWDAIVNVDLKGYFNCAQVAARQMLSQGTGGSIIMNSSIASVVGMDVTVAYAAAKGGVNQLVRAMALEWADKNIRVNAIAPGYIDNIMEGCSVGYTSPQRQQQTQTIINTFVPMKRKGKVEELVGPVVFLASSASTYVTGAILMVDGGYSAM
ncbi:3-oxoacyl-[acyl-carrier-protein] reductase like (plasmid) [Cylindrospermum sp. NIES-4074]|nr:3-oxoacyl-[acyl-carrier-protein] reductase like [Cylindrospermum sp. NIES-4074]